MRVALISDLHGNLVALEAALAELDRRGVDRIISLGDVATLGPHPAEVLDCLAQRGIPSVLGNHDEFLLEPELIQRYTEAKIVRDAVDWCRSALSAPSLDQVRGFVRGMELDLGFGATLSLFHGSPRSHMEDILATTPAEELDRFLDGKVATVLAGGHTHLQMLRQHRGMLIVNPGSLGMPFKEYVGGRAPVVLPHAELAIVDARPSGVSVELCRVPLEKRALREAATSVRFPFSGPLSAAYA
ncbi:MAG: metallophosphoesterase family protein [Myxococcota bacterium]